MYSKCPGQDMRRLRVELFKCPNCGVEVEIFWTRLESSVRNVARWFLEIKYLAVLNGVLLHGNVLVKSAGNS